MGIKDKKSEMIKLSRALHERLAASNVDGAVDQASKIAHFVDVGLKKIRGNPNVPPAVLAKATEPDFVEVGAALPKYARMFVVTYTQLHGVTSSDAYAELIRLGLG